MNLPNFPDVPFAPGVPALLRNPQAALGSVVNNVENQAVGAAQQAIGALQGAVNGGLQAIGGAVSNVQNAISNLPNIAGVGNATGLINGAFGAPADVLSEDDPSISDAATAPGQWGIFTQAGDQVIEFDSFKKISYKKDWRVPDYPMENGAFQSYNKVQTPFDIRLTLTKGGSVTDRTTFLNSIDAAGDSLTLYNVATPEKIYSNVTITHVDYDRTAINGVGLLTVDLGINEIRIAPPSAFSNAATPNGASQSYGGTVQAIPVTTGPNMTDGAPTSSAAFESGSSGNSALAPDATPSTGVSTSNNLNYVSPAILDTETPAVQQTTPVFPIIGTQEPLGANGIPLTNNQISEGIPGYTYTLFGQLQTLTVDSAGIQHYISVIAPPKVQ